MGFQDYISFPIIPQELKNRIQFALFFLNQNTVSHQQEKTCRKTQLVEKTCQFLKESIQEKHSIESLARVMCSNRNTLNQVFKQKLGCTVFHWLRIQRLYIAKKKLRTTQLTIQEICESIGYENPANFATTFRRINGCTPSECRENFDSPQERCRWCSNQNNI